MRTEDRYLKGNGSIQRILYLENKEVYCNVIKIEVVNYNLEELKKITKDLYCLPLPGSYSNVIDISGYKFSVDKVECDLHLFSDGIVKFTFTGSLR